MVQHRKISVKSYGGYKRTCKRMSSGILGLLLLLRPVLAVGPLAARTLIDKVAPETAAWQTAENAACH